jgi:hypothetical protein
MRRQLREFGKNLTMTRLVSAEENTVPAPSSALRWLDEKKHQAAKHVRRYASEHPLREEAWMVRKGLEDPFVVESFRCHRSLNGEPLPFSSSATPSAR